MAKKPTGPAGRSAETILTHGGRTPRDQFGFVNTPVYRGSTVLFETLDELDDPHLPYRYGRQGNPTTRGVEAIITELEGAAGTVLAPSGLAAISDTLLALLGAGDEILVTDSAYDPTRNFCAETLTRFGVTTTFYDPRLGAAIEGLVSAKTRVIFVESPGSLTFEIQDLPAIAEVARRHGIAVVVDNSWATPLYCRPLALGANVVIHTATKMFVGHSDTMLGTASADAEWWPRLRRSHRLLGMYVSADDAFLVARGLRTLAIRMKEHMARAIDLAQWFEGQPGVRAVIHPALPSHPDHALWQRDFTGSGSLFGVLLDPAPRRAVAAMVDGFELFGMGYSWGGYESLCLPIKPEEDRTAVPWTREGNLFRVHVGLEDLDELKADMAAALARYRSA